MRNTLLKAAWTLSACLPILALAPQALAQGADGPHRERGWEWSLSGGLIRVDPFLRDFLTSGAPESRFEAPGNLRRLTPVIEGRLGYNFTPNLGLSVSVNDAFRSGVSYLNLGESITYTMNLNDNMSPYIIGGVDLTRITGLNSRITHSTWGAHLGLGIRRMIGDALALRVEGRVQSAGYRENPMRVSTTYAPIGLVGLSYFVGGHGPERVVVQSAPCPVCETPRPLAARVDTVRMARIVRVDTLRSVRVDTVRVVEENADQVILRVQFRTNRTELLAISYPVLNTVAKAIKTTPDSRWKVEGHTDSIGKKPANLILSKGRAQSVLEYLVSRGVPRDILEAEGYGAARQVFSNTTAFGRAENRRVQLRRIPKAPKVVVP